MKHLTRRQQKKFLLPIILLVGLILFRALPVAIAQTMVIPNTGTANYRTGVREEVRNIQSNSTTVTAVVVPAAIEVIKSGDRAAAEPGDTTVYRLLVRNTGEATIRNVVITDTLPLGMRFLSESIQASLSINNNSTPLELLKPNVTNRTITFEVPSELAPKQILNIVYAVTLTPDAIRGDGRNAVAVTGSSGQRQVRSSIATHQLRIRPGILADCGTLIGRVFVDKNFDGEQQSGEPGVPNAVIFLDDGNRITTDANGLFSVANVISGNRTGTLDLSSLPGYTLAPNLYFIEKNSQSRLVRLEPGGTARMNFAVTPAFGEQSER